MSAAMIAPGEASAARDLLHEARLTLSDQELWARLDLACRQNDDAKLDLWKEHRRRTLHYRILERHENEKTPEGRAYLYELARRNVLSFMRVYGTLHEPGAAISDRPTIIPFIPYPHQWWGIRFLQELFAEARRLTEKTGQEVRGITGATPKSREHGMTWLYLHFIVHHYLFREGFSTHMGSRIAELVDKNPRSRNPDTLFGRIELILDDLPGYLLPRGFNLDDKTLRQENMLNHPLLPGNRITGEASSPNFGRQDRYSFIYLDEFDYLPDAAAVNRGSRDSATVRLMVSNPNPEGDGTFFRLIETRKVKVLDLHWWYHPGKTRAWRKLQDDQRLDEEKGSELDLSWEGANELRVYPEWSRVPQGDFPYRPDWETYGSIDFGRTDGTGIIWAQRSPQTGRVRVIASYYIAGQTIDYFFPFFGKPITSGIHTYSSDELELIQLAQYWGRGGIQWFGDPSGSQTTQSANLSVIQQLAQAGVYVATNERIKAHNERQSITKRWLRRMEVCKDRTASLDSAMKNYRKPKPRGDQMPEGRVKPVHNWASHLATAMEYLCVGLETMAAPREEQDAPAPTRRAAAWEEIGAA